MAKKKGGIGRLFGAITGSPYERLLKQIDKLLNEHGDNDKKLGNSLGKLVKVISNQYNEDNIDEEEHDLLVEAIEEVDPQGRIFDKLSEDDDTFYSGGDVPDAPQIKSGKKVNLDDLMRSRDDSFSGSFGRDEFDEFKARMSAEFMRESHEAVEAGDHHHSQELGGDHRVFGDAEDELSKVKSEIAEESGLSDPSAGEGDEDYYVDEDGCEWWKDDDGYWWYRPAGDEDWHPYEE